jgi:hypothetical protein
MGVDFQKDAIFVITGVANKYFLSQCFTQCCFPSPYRYLVLIHRVKNSPGGP